MKISCILSSFHSIDWCVYNARFSAKIIESRGCEYTVYNQIKPYQISETYEYFSGFLAKSYDSQ